MRTRPARSAKRIGQRRGRAALLFGATGAVGAAATMMAGPAGASAKVVTVTAIETEFHITLTKRPSPRGATRSSPRTRAT